MRKILVTPLEDSVKPFFLTHFLMTSWPDHGVPEITDFLQLLQAVRVGYSLLRFVFRAGYGPGTLLSLGSD